MIGDAYGTAPHGALSLAGSGAVPNQPAATILAPLNTDEALFFASEITLLDGGTTPVVFSHGHGTAPHGALALATQTFTLTTVMRNSDIGYVSKAADTIGVQSYRPDLTTAFAINRRIALNPSSDKTSAAWGSLTFSNADGHYDDMSVSYNSDSRPVNILAGVKVRDRARGIVVDPAYSALYSMFGGVATPWFCDETSLQIPLRDATYWLDQPLQATLYAGTGGLEGGDGITESLLTQPNLIGLPKPMARGGTRAHPIQNITPVLVDAVNLIYQYNDGPGTVVGLTVDGLANAIAFQADVTDLYSGSTGPGYYRTCNAKGLFQLGASTGTLTADVTGAWPDGSAATTGAAMALKVLQIDAALAAQFIDAESFTYVDLQNRFLCGYFTGTTATTANTVVAALLASIGGCMMPKRTGQLGAIALRALATDAQPEASYDLSTIVSVTPQSLGAPLDPPPYRWRVGVCKNWTVQSSGLNTTLSVLRKSFLGQEYTTQGWGYQGAGWSNPTIQLSYARPSDPDVLPSYLLTAADGKSLAAELGALWGVSGGMSLYAVKVPLALGIRHEIGSILRITWPARNLGTGKLGQVVGEQVTSSDSTTTLLILISNAQG